MPLSYLDWAASAPPYADTLERAAAIAAAEYANPSSAHAAGKSARAVVESARATLAATMGALPERVVFTSGGSEADSIPLLSVLLPGDGKAGSARPSIVISAIEHAAVFEQARLLEELGVTVLRVAPDAEGFVRPDAVSRAIRPDTALVAVMAVNNETGAIQPVAEIAAAVGEAGKAFRRPPWFHCDAVQALGSVGFDALGLGVDSAAVSGHKLGGPRGIGALYMRRAVPVMSRGGGQEGGLRPGTLNVAGAWAFGKAAARAASDREPNLLRARRLEAALLEGIRSIGGAVAVPASRRAGDPRYSPYIVSLAFPGLGGEVMARLLDEEGISVSTGAACSGSRKGRRVLDAMGVDPDLSFSAIRVSTGRDSSPEDIARFLESAAAAYARYKL
jgi:cysteine desulfurase